LRGAELLQAVACAAQVRGDLERLAQIRGRALDVAEPHFGLAAIVPRKGIGRIVLQRLVVVGNAIASPSANAAGACANITAAPRSDAAKCDKWRINLVLVSKFTVRRRFASPGSRA